MLSVLALATLALATPAPITVQFTSDSVYKNSSIIEPSELIEQEDGLYTIVLEETKLLGYCIYDKKDTDYIDGLRFDDKLVYNYAIENVDLSVEHTLFVKTVYTDDVAGMLAAAKAGDWSIALQNPLILVQLFYYILAAFSIVLGGFGLLKSKKKKIKTTDEIAAAINAKATAASDSMKDEAMKLFDGMVVPLLSKLKVQNQTMMESLILFQVGDKDSKIAAIELLKNSATENIDEFSENVKKSIENAASQKEALHQEAQDILRKLSSLPEHNEEPEEEANENPEVRF